MLLSSKCIVQRIFILTVILTAIQVESIFSSSAAAKARRTRSLRAYGSKPELNHNSIPASTSSTKFKDTESNPLTSVTLLSPVGRQKCVCECFNEANLRPAVDGIMHVSTSSKISFSEAAAAKSSTDPPTQSVRKASHRKIVINTALTTNANKVTNKVVTTTPFFDPDGIINSIL